MDTQMDGAPADLIAEVKHIRACLHQIKELLAQMNAIDTERYGDDIRMCYKQVRDEVTALDLHLYLIEH
jgi:hypothetical protein